MMEGSFCQDIGRARFQQCYSDQDVWRRASVKKDGTKYYEYILVYVENQLTISEDPKAIIDALQTPYDLKDVGPPSYKVS